MRNFILGLIIGLLLIPAGAFLYFRYGNPAVATADPPLPFEKRIVQVPMMARIDREKPKAVPIQADGAAFAAGARIYLVQCEACHGLPERPSGFAKYMFPRAPQLFQKHGKLVGVSDDEPGETFWKVKNGIRLSGMPAYTKLLSETEMWQVSLLLANADKLPPEVMTVLKPTGMAAPAATP